MKKVMLNDIITFTLGKNPTRIKESDNNIYGLDDFEKDFHSTEKLDIRGCAISIIKSKASPLSSDSDKKTMISNYVKCYFDPKVLDPWYLCYQINEGKEVEQQINMFNQGTLISVRKLNVKIISELSISLPDIKKQRLIGELYRKSIIQQDLLQKQADNLKNLNMLLIRKIEEE